MNDLFGYQQALDSWETVEVETLDSIYESEDSDYSYDYQAAPKYDYQPRSVSARLPKMGRFALSGVVGVGALAAILFSGNLMIAYRSGNLNQTRLDSLNTASRSLVILGTLGALGVAKVTLGGRDD